MSHALTQEDARAIARVLYAVHQRRAAREAAEQAQQGNEEPRCAEGRSADA